MTAGDSPPQWQGPGEQRAGEAQHLPQRIAMAAATAFLAVNIWTGAPLLALWVGSRVVGEQTLSMQAVFVVVLVLAVLLYGLARALAWLNAAYDQLTGRPAGERRVAWLVSMNAGGQDNARYTRASTVLELIVMLSVCVAVISLAVWFFLLAGSPLPH